MKNKLFGKDIPPKCLYCSFGSLSYAGDEILCSLTGIRSPDSYCKKFKYDPLKRTPEKPKIMGAFSEDDFKL